MVLCWNKTWPFSSIPWKHKESRQLSSCRIEYKVLFKSYPSSYAYFSTFFVSMKNEKIKLECLWRIHSLKANYKQKQ